MRRVTALKKLLRGMTREQAQSFMRRNPHLAARSERTPVVLPGPVSSVRGRVEVRLDEVRLVAEVNDRQHWTARSLRARRQHEAVRDALVGMLVPAGPWVVTITRESPGMPDSDNVTGSAKHVRDAVAAWLGTGDAPTAPVRWVTQHVRRPRGHAVVIAIETDESVAP